MKNYWMNNSTKICILIQKYVPKIDDTLILKLRCIYPFMDTLVSNDNLLYRSTSSLPRK